MSKLVFYKTFQRSISLVAVPKYDVVIVGGGIVGTATARQLITDLPKLKFAIIEKEQSLGVHQSGHNSGVLHTGIYYKPGTLKAKLCVEGIQLAYKYFDEHNIPYKKCGKLIVAVNGCELSRLKDLYDRGIQNGVENLKLVNSKEIKDIEPNCTGLRAIWSPDTGIVDWGLVTKSFGDDFELKGGKIHSKFEVKELRILSESLKQLKENEYPILISNGKNSILSKYVITCGGLQSDQLAQMSGCNPYPSIVPFRGEYLVLGPEKKHLVRGNIYPVPDPKLPFLGVHFTPRMDGSIWLGPNAVLAFKREGYKPTDVEFKELCSFFKNRGLRKLVFKHWQYGLAELYRGVNIASQVRKLQEYVPKLNYRDVKRGPTGVRAQALDQDGNLVDDFVFDYGQGELSKRIIHLRNAPSPGATSSLAIAKVVAKKCTNSFQL